MGRRAKKTPLAKKLTISGTSLLAVAGLVLGAYFLFFNKSKQPGIILKKTGQAEAASEIDFNKSIRILVLGSDSRTRSIKGSRSDGNMLVQLNPNGSAYIVSFPRDSYVSIAGGGTGKINSALALGGAERAVKTVENYSGLKIDYYMVASFPRFTGIINDIGGLEFTFKEPLVDRMAGANFSAGTKKLRGGEALAVARARHVAGGDFTRQAHQQDLAIAALKQERKKAKDMSGILGLVRVLTKHLETNLSSKEVFNLVRVIFKINPAKIQRTVLKGGTGGGGASVVNLDRAYANKVFAQMQKSAKSEVDSGK